MKIKLFLTLAAVQIVTAAGVVLAARLYDNGHAIAGYSFAILAAFFALNAAAAIAKELNH